MYSLYPNWPGKQGKLLPSMKDYMLLSTPDVYMVCAIMVKVSTRVKDP